MTIMQQARKHKALMALGLVTAGTTLSVTSVAHADITAQTAEGFDLTKQATAATFPVMFDRPSGVNAAALAGAVRSLGGNAKLYQSAVAAVPELANSKQMSQLLSDALSEDASLRQPARETILKLINWYNGLGGFQIKAQDGSSYTVANLDLPINTIAVGFANPTANKAVSDDVQNRFGKVRTTGDVMTALEGVKSGVTADYKAQFASYAQKVNAPNANLEALSQYNAVKPLLDSYERMYANGAANLRTQLLRVNGTTEAAVAFFESAVITGRVDATDGGTSNQNTPNQSEFTTRYVDENGKNLEDPMTGSSYGGEKTFDGYTLTGTKVENNVKTYTYSKNQDPKPQTEVTRWIDKTTGENLKDETSGTHVDTDGNDIPGYRYVGHKTVNDDNKTVTQNFYEKIKPDMTEWVDEETGKVMKSSEGQHPDKEGDDIPGYDFTGTTTKTVDGSTKVVNTYRKSPKKPEVKDLTRWVIKSTGDVVKTQDGKHPDKEGDDLTGYRLVGIEEKMENGSTTITNLYEKLPETPEKTGKTYWVDTTGGNLKDSVDGSFPDNDGQSDIPGHTLVTSYTVTEKDLETRLKGSHFKPGDVLNIYKKDATPSISGITTRWIYEDGTVIKESEGSHPDKEGDDIPGSRIIRTIVDENGNTENVYRKNPKTTIWIDENGKEILPKKDGEHPDKEGDDVPGYKLIESGPDKDGNIVNRYRKITTSWIDENGKEILPKKDGEHPDKEGDDVPGYKLIESGPDKDGNIVNRYRKITTSWIDENGKEILPKKDGEHPDKEGDDVPGYKLIESGPDKDGNIVNRYRKITTSWIDENGKEILPKKDGEHPDKEGDDVPGYKLIESGPDKDGNIVNRYHKIMTHYVDESGTKIASSKEGSHPDKEGDDVVGWTFIESRIDPKTGDVFNIYKKVTKSVITHYVDESGKRLLDDETGSEFAKEKSIKDYELKDVRMSEDGTEKFYVYKKAEGPKELPKTGDATSGLATAVGTGLLSVGGFIARRKRRKGEDA